MSWFLPVMDSFLLRMENIMAEFNHYWVCYDISSDKMRTRIEKVISGFGLRIQYSVFDCCISTYQLSQLIEKLRKAVSLKLFDKTTDSILIIPCCNDCFKKMSVFGADKRTNGRYTII
jgi:CRISPR-associated protein Cas2